MIRSSDLFRFVRAHRRRSGAAGRNGFFSTLLHAACPGAEAALQGCGSAEVAACAAILPASLVQELRDDPLLVGWAYQIWNEPERKDSTWGVSRRDELQREQLKLTAATQLFTDEQMGAFLCARALLHGKLDAGLCDPACGVGHLLVQALRALHAQRPEAAVEDLLLLLFGFDIDPVAVQISHGILAAEVLRLGARNVQAALAVVRERIVALDAPFGTLDRTSTCTLVNRTYGCVLANPPYLGRRKLTQETREFLDREYPDCSFDLCAAFVQRSLELLAPGGFLGLVTHDKWLRLKGYRTLRNGAGSFGGIYRELEVDTICELGMRAFDRRMGLHDGLGVALLSAIKAQPRPAHELLLLSLVGLADSAEKGARLAALRGDLTHGVAEGRLIPQEVFRHEPHDRIFMDGPGVPAALLVSRRQLSTEATIIVGLQTNDDRRFVRNHWEVALDPVRWRVHSKGGGYGRWFGLNRTVLDWGEGRSVFERSAKSGLSVEPWFEQSGWVYSWFANGSLGMRAKDAGWSFGRAASSGLFCDDERIVAFLNSRFGSLCVRRLGGKVQLPEGVVRRLPLPSSLDGISPELVREAVCIKRELVSSEITEITFDPSSQRGVLEYIALEAVLRMIEAQLELQVSQALGVSPRTQTLLESGAVGFLPISDDTSLDEFWILVPQKFRRLRPLLEEVTVFAGSCKGAWQEAEQEGLRSAMLRGSLPRSCQRDLPADGWLERLCSALRLNPIEAAVRISREHAQRAEVWRALELPAAEQQLFVLLLEGVGHRFWGASDLSNAAQSRTLTLQAAAALVSGTSQALRIEQTAGVSAAAWIAEAMEAWQRRVFGPRGALAITRQPEMLFSSVQVLAA